LLADVDGRLSRSPRVFAHDEALSGPHFRRWWRHVHERCGLPAARRSAYRL